MSARLAWEVWFSSNASATLDRHIGVTVFNVTEIGDAIRLATSLTGGGPRLYLAALVRVGNKEFPQ